MAPRELAARDCPLYKFKLETSTAEAACGMRTALGEGNLVTVVPRCGPEDFQLRVSYSEMHLVKLINILMMANY